MNEEQKFSVKAVIIGLLIGILGAIVASTIITFVAIRPMDVAREAGGDRAEVKRLVQQRFAESTNALAGMLVFQAGFAVLAGFGAGRIAKSRHLKHALWVGIIWTGVGLITTLISRGGAMPLWYNALDLVTLIPGALLGGYLATPDAETS